MSGATHGMTGSYNSNSVYQLAAVQSSIPLIREAIEVFDVCPSSMLLIIADYGSSHGHNSIYSIKVIIDYLKSTKQIDESKQVLVVHNDLPTNNWTVLFEILNQDNSYHGVANGRSFYELCLPSNSVSIGYSSSSVHWLSRKPCNVSNHCISQFAQGDDLKAFQEQARLDLAQFLEHRSRELHVGGVFILNIWTLDEHESSGIEYFLHLLYKCAQSCSLTQQELLEYTIPIYARPLAACIDFELFDRCSFKLIKSEFKKLESPLNIQYQEGQITFDEYTQRITQHTRCWAELSLRQALEMNGRSKEDIEKILTRFWTLYQEQIKESPHNCDATPFMMYLVLKKVSIEK